MALTRRSISTLVVVGACTLAALGVTGALAQSDDATSAAGGDLVERLVELDADLPVGLPVADLVFAADDPVLELIGDAASSRALLDLVEPDLRRLFVEADDGAGPTDEAVAQVARGWLDVWNGADALARAESHDLAFPVDATDDLGAAAGADELRGEREIGLELIVRGHEQLLAGYQALDESELDDPIAAEVVAERAAAFASIDLELVPQLAVYLGHPGTTVIIPVERFRTDAPGVRSRAGSVDVICVDREQFLEAGGRTDAETLATLLETVDERVDCPGLDLPTVDPDDIEFPDDDATTELFDD